MKEPENKAIKLAGVWIQHQYRNGPKRQDNPRIISLFIEEYSLTSSQHIWDIIKLIIGTCQWVKAAFPCCLNKVFKLKLLNPISNLLDICLILFLLKKWSKLFPFLFCIMPKNEKIHIGSLSVDNSFDRVPVEVLRNITFCMHSFENCNFLKLLIADKCHFIRQKHIISSAGFKWSDHLLLAH